MRGGSSPPPHDDRNIRAKDLKSSGRMMIEKVMIQVGAKRPKKKAAGLGGGRQTPHDDRKIRGKEPKK